MRQIILQFVIYFIFCTPLCTFNYLYYQNTLNLSPSRDEYLKPQLYFFNKCSFNFNALPCFMLCTYIRSRSKNNSVANVQCSFVEHQKQNNLQTKSSLKFGYFVRMFFGRLTVNNIRTTTVDEEQSNVKVGFFKLNRTTPQCNC